MKSLETLKEIEESIREEVKALTDEQRKEFYKLSAKKLKDPDTYAALNFVFFFGLHNFYIGKWISATIAILLTVIGIAFFLVGGFVLIIALFIFELYELFFSQNIIIDHNNRINQKILAQIKNK